MDRKVVEALIRNFLQRLIQNEFHLSDSISEMERFAIIEYSRSESDRLLPPDAYEGVDTQPLVGPGRDGNEINLDLTCLEATPSFDTIVGVDFGTAFSKATLWLPNARHPIPLELLVSASGQKGLLLDSTLYVSVVRNKLFFGPQAIEVSREEDEVGRLRFDSPKQVLSIEGIEGLALRADAAIDPTQQFAKRDLLTLYLAYLSANISDQLEQLGHSRHLLRRFAIPVWSAAQLGETARVLKQMLIDAQILADTISLDAWKSGLDIHDAKAAIRTLRECLPDNDERRTLATLIGGHVLEASAAAAAIGEELENKRPVALVMDVGAGTTDIGLFFFVFPDDQSDRSPKIAPFIGGSVAKKIAGDRLDRLLTDFIKRKANLGEGDPELFRVKRDIRDIKRRLTLTGIVRIEGVDDVEIRQDEFVSSTGVQEYRNELRATVAALISKVGPENIKGQDGLFAVLTGGGSGFPVFDGFFDQPFQTADASVSFRLVDARPVWLSTLDPAYSQIFAQLAVAFGVSAPNLPDEVRAISAVPNVNLQVLGLPPSYRGH